MDFFPILMGLATSMSTAIDITSECTGSIFTDNEIVRFHMETTANARLSVTDYAGKKVFEKDFPAGQAEVEIGTLPRNHYTVIVRGGDELEKTCFGVVPSMESRSHLEDPRIASDVAMSWLVKPDRFDELAQLTKLSGVIWVRDRIRWGEVETQRGHWAKRNRYDLSAEAQMKHGLKVYQVFHDTPGWAQREEKTHSFPDDLRDAYNFAAEMARRFKGKVAAWEVWNEPDIIHFSDELGDSYSALLKAMYLGFKSADPELPVLLCSFAMGPGRFAETIFQNDVQNYFDIYNYHIYDKWENHAGRALKHIELMRRYGLERKPVWLTEAGRPIKREPDLVELTPEQGRDVAEFLPKAIISSLSAGVDKYFWFIMPYYRERDVMLFGLLRDDMTPTPGYCALSACTYALGEANYLGRLDVAGVHAHVFDRGDDRFAVSFWTDEGERVFSLHVDPGKGTLVSLMGSEQEMDISEGIVELEASPSVRYLILDALKDTLRIDYPREKPETKRSYDPTTVSPIVLRLQFARESRDKKSDTYLLPGDSPTKVGVQVYNFGKDQFPCKLKLHLPEGYQGALDGEEVSVSPMGRVVREFEISPGVNAGSEPVQIRVDLMNLSGEVETFILAWLAIKPN
jgi:hypothetical protein